MAEPAELASARKELAERRDDASKCMAELKAAQATVANDSATTPKKLTVTVKEVYGDIAVDRVAVRAMSEPAQEKVVVEGIPCLFTVGAGVSTFDLVFMAEHAAPAQNEGADESPTAVAEPTAVVADKLNEATPSAEVTSEEAAPEAVVADAASTADQVEEAATVVETQEGPEGDEVVVGATVTGTTTAGGEGGENGPEEPASESPADSVAAAVGEATTEVAAAAEDAVTAGESVGPSVVEGESGGEVGEAPTAAVSAAVNGEADGDGAAVANAMVDEKSVVEAAAEAASAATTAAAEATAGSAANDENGPSSAAAMADEKPESSPAAAETGTAASTSTPAEPSSLGCSTVTTEIVVPSSEIDLKSTAGQWRYLDAGATPGEGDDTSPVEVSKGVKFTAVLETPDGGDAESRIIDLSTKCDEAELRLRAAEAAVEKLSATPPRTERKQSPAAPASGRKSALKKSARRKQDGSRSAGASTQKGRGGMMAAVSGKVERVYTMAKPVALVAWSCRNLVMFASAVAAIHYHGEYLAV